MMDTVVSVSHFRKTYGSFVAVDDISFNVQRGEIFGLLGPNGAGKTSTLETLEGIRHSDGGSLEVLGIDPVREPGRLKDVIGVQLQTSGLPGNMKVGEAMRFFCAYHRVTPRMDLIERMGLTEKEDTQYQQLSTGQQRRLALALSVSHQPSLLILDEPTAGLDVNSRSELHDMMLELRKSGTAILLATHDMAEAEKLADRVSVLLGGRVVANGSPRELTTAGSGLTKISIRTEGSIFERKQVKFPAVSQQLFKDDYAIFYSKHPGTSVPALLRYIERQKDTLIDLRVERPSLEERFLEITTPGGGRK
jgi:ABC-2 type transport system ATP-binding protein